MRTILITGARGFIGRNLALALSRDAKLKVLGIDLEDGPEVLAAAVAEADAVFHLAGVNRPEDPSEFETGNTGLTVRLVSLIEKRDKPPLVVLSSSIQAALDNPYGRSKRGAEEVLQAVAESRCVPVRLFRLPNVFGKWCRPNYNSAVATFCHNIAHDLEIVVSDPAREVELVYVDEVVAAFSSLLAEPAEPGCRFVEVAPTFRITLGNLVERIRGFREIRQGLVVPDLSDPLTRRLHATYLSYLSGDELRYGLEQRTDARGTLAELLKSRSFGQIFVSRTLPGIVRGNHYHDTKNEKFCVVEGDALIRLRHLATGEIAEHRICGKDFAVIDIPPGWTHSIENIGSSELVVLFWASEVFDPQAPDTYMAKV